MMLAQLLSFQHYLHARTHAMTVYQIIVRTLSIQEAQLLQR